MKVKSPAHRATARGHFQARIVGCGLPSLPVCLLFPLLPPDRPGLVPVLVQFRSRPIHAAFLQGRRKRPISTSPPHLTQHSGRRCPLHQPPRQSTPPSLSSNRHVHLAGRRHRPHQRRPLPFSKHRPPPYFVADGIGSRWQTPRQHLSTLTLVRPAPARTWHASSSLSRRRKRKRGIEHPSYLPTTNYSAALVLLHRQRQQPRPSSCAPRRATQQPRWRTTARSWT